MKAGRVIGGDEHDATSEAKRAAQQLLEDARAEVKRLREAAENEASTLLQTARDSAAHVKNDVKTLAARILNDARADAARLQARAGAEATRLRDDARVLANHLVEGARHVANHPREADGEDDPGDTDSGPVVVGDAITGHVEEVVGLVVRANVPGVALGEVVRIDRRAGEPVSAEVVGFRGEQAVLLPLGDLAGVAPAGTVWRTGETLAIRCGDDLLGRVVDGIGQPIDDGPELGGERWAVDRPAPAALARPPITEPQPTGVRVLDTMLTLGRGQRVGLFSAAGVGKSTLLGQIARGAGADVVVLCQVGERGRELAELLDHELAHARARTIVVCATSDAPPLVRLRAVHVATAIAEWFREKRRASVLLLVDSLTRVARAQREVGLSAGEPPARHGYPPSVFALLPRLIERAGATPEGSITAIYTVLVAGNDMDEPIADEVRGLVDGHIVLDRRLAQRGHFPPIDVVASVSRLMSRVVEPRHAEAAARVRTRLAIYEEHRDLITLGAYQAGRDRQIDEAVACYPKIEKLLRQARDESAGWDTAIGRLLELAH
ncbi:MAG: Flagellum-specific synthase FliI [Myxococcales bacterium]|nr:Flagellum-specific synthase FliI [Myxococcales bacterium]